jgi:murein DD-endopeptidase MepM/ murein hydrolase activator NlpD
VADAITGSKPVAHAPAPQTPGEAERTSRPEATTGSLDQSLIADLSRRRLSIPVEGIERSQLRDTFDERRGGIRQHEALDIMAPRGTPVHAVENGQIAKLFKSIAGGLTVYQFDPEQHFAYYYAHLDRYAPGLQEGQNVKRGDLIGYVGSTGNASEDAPHLHFAIFHLTADRQWWNGHPINPYPVLR